MPLASRLLATVPDAVTASVFAWLWIEPLYFGKHAVANGMLIMLVEFILLHASIFLGNTAFAVGVSRRRKTRAILGFGLFYLLFIVAWSLAFGEWWPFVAFAWLLIAKLALVMQPGQQNVDRLQRMQSAWAMGAMAYLGGVFLTVFVPLPRLGLQPGVVSQLDLPGGGLWVNQPHTVIAFGAIYFATLAIVKYRDVRLPAQQLPGNQA